MDYIPFDKRFGILPSILVTDSFPDSARIGLSFILEDLVDKNFIEKEYNEKTKYKFINYEIARICRDMNPVTDSRIHPKLYQMEWYKVYEFIERMYHKLKEVYKYDINGNIEYEEYNLTFVQEYYSKEIKNLLSEENIGYDFHQGLFNRKGYLKTSKAINSAMAVLSDPKLNKSRLHYMKAIQYFNKIKEPDYENTIKESICALEASLITLFSPEISKNFDLAIRKLSGNDISKIPAPIIESIIKLYGYRNSGSGVAHATDKGLKVTAKEAELIISLTADYITYFYSVLNNCEDENAPF